MIFNYPASAIKKFKIFYDTLGADPPQTFTEKKKKGGAKTPYYISTRIPIKDKYKFLNMWKSVADGTLYNSGEVYTEDKDLSLEAMYHKLFTIYYDTKGGTPASYTGEKEEGLDYQIIMSLPSWPLSPGETTPSKIFVNWKDHSSSTIYNPGDYYTIDADLNLDARYRLTEILKGIDYTGNWMYTSWKRADNLPDWGHDYAEAKKKDTDKTLCIALLSSGNLTFNGIGEIDACLVGAGGQGGLAVVNNSSGSENSAPGGESTSNTIAIFDTEHSYIAKKGVAGRGTSARLSNDPISGTGGTLADNNKGGTCTAKTGITASAWTFSLSNIGIMPSGTAVNAFNHSNGFTFTGSGGTAACLMYYGSSGSVKGTKRLTDSYENGNNACGSGTKGYQGIGLSIISSDNVAAKGYGAGSGGIAGIKYPSSSGTRLVAAAGGGSGGEVINLFNIPVEGSIQYAMTIGPAVSAKTIATSAGAQTVTATAGATGAGIILIKDKYGDPPATITWYKYTAHLEGKIIEEEYDNEDYTSLYSFIWELLADVTSLILTYKNISTDAKNRRTFYITEDDTPMDAVERDGEDGLARYIVNASGYVYFFKNGSNPTTPLSGTDTCYYMAHGTSTMSNWNVTKYYFNGENTTVRDAYIGTEIAMSDAHVEGEYENGYVYYKTQL